MGTYVHILVLLHLHTCECECEYVRKKKLWLSCMIMSLHIYQKGVAQWCGCCLSARRVWVWFPGLGFFSGELAPAMLKPLFFQYVHWWGQTTVKEKIICLTNHLYLMVRLPKAYLMYSSRVLNHEHTMYKCTKRFYEHCEPLIQIGHGHVPRLTMFIFASYFINWMQYYWKNRVVVKRLCGLAPVADWTQYFPLLQKLNPLRNVGNSSSSLFMMLASWTGCDHEHDHDHEQCSSLHRAEQKKKKKNTGLQ